MLSIASFFNDYDRLRSTSTSPGLLPFPLFFANNLEGKTYGAELTVAWQVRDWWRLNAGYTALNENIRVKAGQFDFNNAINETADPENRASIRSSMNLRKDVEFDVHIRWSDSFLYNTSGVPSLVPAYAEADARLAWRPGKLIEIALIGRNLFHNRHLEYVISGSNPPEKIKRAVFVKLSLRR